jgi:hypothetical protein
MDTGFVRESKSSYKDEDGQIVTRIDGYNSYLLIVDRATRYTWVLLAKTKTPQVENIRKFLEIHRSKRSTQHFVGMDEGGEL